MRTELTMDDVRLVAPPQPNRRPGRLPHGDHWLLTMAALAVAVISFSLSTTLLLPVLPALEARFATSSTLSSWVITVYMLVAAVANPVVGRLGDLHGKRRTLLVVLGFLVVGAIGAMLATSVQGVIAARAVQGVAGAVLPLSVGIVRERLTPQRRPLAIALIAAMTAVGGGVGLPLGGVLVEAGSVDLVFQVVVGLSLLAFTSTALFVPESARRARGRLDLGGAALLASAVVCTLLAVSTGAATRWAMPGPPLLLLAGLAAGVAWWSYELRRADPLVDVRVLRRKPVLLTNVMTLLMALGLFGAFSLIPVIAQTGLAAGGLGLTPAAAGLLMLPTAVVTFLAAPVAGIAIRRRGAKAPLVASCLLVVGGLLGLGLVGIGALALAVGAAFMGIGFGVLTAAAPNLIVASVGELETGAQTGINTMVQNIGTSAGSQLAAVLLTAAAVSGTNSLLGTQLPLMICAGAVLLAGLAALFIDTSSSEARGASAGRNSAQR